jgi:hypothetical protein
MHLIVLGFSIKKIYIAIMIDFIAYILGIIISFILTKYIFKEKFQVLFSDIKLYRIVEKMI